MKKLRVYFMGSGNIAVPVLQELARSKDRIELIGVGTQPDRPSGRRNRVQSTPVGAAAPVLGIEPDKIETAAAPDFIAHIRELAPDFLLVISFGQLLRDALLEIPRFGGVNIHASVLPRYRGASPITACLARGDSYTGVTFIRMVKKLDAGDIYRIIRYPLTGRERCDELEVRLGLVAAAGTVDTLCGIADGSIVGTPQDESMVSVTCKIRKDDGRIDWRWSAETVEAVTRAFYPWPGALMTLLFGDREENITVHAAKVRSDVSAPPGTIVRADKNGFIVGCGSGAVELLEITPAGRRKMPAVAYLNGCKISSATVKTDIVP
ncbi:MAG: methionyl-tRNA formyltransferase [Victivallaceae bacterium]|nr:methionyl-tRNA formyltransferase [Victivallaceae bacterium]